VTIALAMWTHGHSVQVEDPSWPVQRTGNAGRIARSNTAGWCHFAVPTPVIVADRRLRIDSVLLRYFTGDESAIHAVHIWDGDTRLAIHENLSLSGPNRVDRFQVEGKPEVRWGIGISVNVGFGFELEEAWIEFNAAGADFE
jgi:hypothetical protein